MICAALVLELAGLPAYGENRAIPLTGGKTISRAILGQNVYCQTSAQRNLDMKIVQNSSMRGVAGGLWADSYDWKNLTGIYLGPQTTLDMLREARDRNTEFVITANCRGIGSGTGSSFVYTDRTTATSRPGSGLGPLHKQNRAQLQAQRSHQRPRQ